MKTFPLILILLLIPLFFYGQENINSQAKEDTEEELMEGEQTLTQDSIHHHHDHSDHDDHFHDLEELYSDVDTTRSIRFWRITERTGEIVQGNPDTLLTDYFNRTSVEGQGISVAYLGNLGLPAESRIFFDRADRSDFMFLDHFWPYTKTPSNFNFINTKIPYSNVSYQRAGGKAVREERLQAILAVNFGKKLNVGLDIDYLYARGLYNSQQSKHIEWTLFSSYIADRHQFHFFFNPLSYTNAENGGVKNDDYIANPDNISSGNMTSQNIPVNFENAWNQIKGKQVYLNYHYNLGFDKETNFENEEGETITRFIPVSSIIYTLDYKDRTRKFYSNGTNSALDEFYDNRNYLINNIVNDSIAYWSLKNTVALSLREGFSSWSKFDLTAFISHEVRNFSLPRIDMQDQPFPSSDTDTIAFFDQDRTVVDLRRIIQNATYAGGEIAKRNGKILRYDAQGEFGILGHNLGDFRLSGHIETRIPVLKDTASVDLYASIKNLSPTFYETNYASKYFKWGSAFGWEQENNFKKVNKQYLAGKITIPHTRTKLGLGVENLTNYIYFDTEGYPQQYDGNIQVIAAQLEQDFKFGIFNWDSKLVYQVTSDKERLPLPAFSGYTSMYIDFKIAQVLTIQLGASAHYWTKYYSPTYEPATQQFRLQHEVEVGNYPLVSGFLNCHLKQTRFYIQYYNIAPYMLSPTEYFSLPHYPVNPSILRLGLSVDFIN